MKTEELYHYDDFSTVLCENTQQQQVKFLLPQYSLTRGIQRFIR
jgi:hypothetical protein